MICPLTFHIHEDGSRCGSPQFVLTCAVIVPGIRGGDGCQDNHLFVTEGLNLFFHILLVPSVCGFDHWVPSTSQGHWMAFSDLPCRNHPHYRNMWHIWRTNVSQQMSEDKLFYKTVTWTHTLQQSQTPRVHSKHRIYCLRDKTAPHMFYSGFSVRSWTRRRWGGRLARSCWGTGILLQYKTDELPFWSPAT